VYSNIVSLLHTQIYFPTYSNSLKEIGRYLGFKWSDDEAVGTSALIWRAEWETEHDPKLKERLIAYNAEDCEAAQRVFEHVAGICSHQTLSTSASECMNVGAIESNYPVRFGKLTYALPDFKSINEAAYWDYQQNRVYFRSKRKPMGQRGPGQLKKPPPNVDKIIRADEPRPPACPKCGSKQFYKNGVHSRTIYDLRFSRAGVRRWVIRYYYQRYQCRDCTHGQNELPRFEKCGKSLQAFVVYQLVELRMSHSAIVRSIASRP
jgi:hypothetical protein